MANATRGKSRSVLYQLRRRGKNVSIRTSPWSSFSSSRLCGSPLRKLNVESEAIRITFLIISGLPLISGYSLGLDPDLNFLGVPKP